MKPCDYTPETGHVGWPFQLPCNNGCQCSDSVLQIRRRVNAGFSRFCCWKKTITTTDKYKTDCGVPGPGESCVSVRTQITPGDDVISAGYAGFEEDCPIYEETNDPCDPPPDKILCGPLSTTVTVDDCPDYEEIPDLLATAAASAATLSEWSEWEDFIIYNNHGIVNSLEAEFSVATISGVSGYYSGYYAEQQAQIRIVGMPLAIKVACLLLSDTDPVPLDLFITHETVAVIAPEMNTSIEFYCAVPVTLLPPMLP